MEVRSVEAIVKALSEAKVKYLVVGGLAVNAYGYARLTDDVDLVIGLEEENIIRGLNALQNIGYRTAVPITPEEFADDRQRNAWRETKNMIVLKLWSDSHRSTPIDVFVFEPFNFSSEYESANWLQLSPGLHVPVIRLEALLEMKRVAGRYQDLADVDNLEMIRKLQQRSEGAIDEG